jgi:hypothetical protein
VNKSQIAIKVLGSPLGRRVVKSALKNATVRRLVVRQVQQQLTRRFLGR